MSRKFSTIEISDVVDHNGAARFGFEDVGAPVNDNPTIAPWLNRRSGDDGKSSRGVAYSSSSASGELRKSKSSLNLFSKLKSRPSKVHLRNDSDDSEHPSLRPPVPPLPEQKTSSLFNISLHGPIMPLKKEKKSKGKKGSDEMSLSYPPPETDNLVYAWDKELKGPMNVDAMNGIINFNIATAGTNGLASSSSTSSAFDSQSYSDHSFHSPNFLLPSFSDPFSGTPVPEKRKAIIPTHGDYCKVSPKTLLPPYGLNTPSTIDKNGPGSPTWVPPESWAVEKTNDDPYNPSGNPELSEAADSGSDDNLHSIPASLVNSKRRTMEYDVPKSRKGKQPNAVEHRITFKVKQPPPDFSYRMKIYRQDHQFHVIAIKLRSTVSELNARLARKLLSADDRVQFNLYLKERGQGTLSKLFPVSDFVLISFL
jgi:adenylate cyclase